MSGRTDEQYTTNTPYGPSSGTTTRYWYALTEEGRDHYVQRLAEHREMYPGVAAPDLPPDATLAEQAH